MAFRANTITLQKGLEQAKQLAIQEKAILTSWQVQLAGAITALDGVAMVASCDRMVAAFNEVAALTGLPEYAQAQEDDVTYNIVTEFNAMVAAISAIATWLKAALPGNSVSVANGALVGASYSTVDTAPLLALVNTAISTIA